MNENIIHLMKTDNQGNDLSELNAKTLHTICQYFGGATVTEGKGLWYSDTGVKFEDDILRVVVAFNPSEAYNALHNNRWAFEELARSYKNEAQQECMYIVMDNQVQFI